MKSFSFATSSKFPFEKLIQLMSDSQVFGSYRPYRNDFDKITIYWMFTRPKDTKVYLNFLLLKTSLFLNKN